MQCVLPSLQRKIAQNRHDTQSKSETEGKSARRWMLFIGCDFFFCSSLFLAIISLVFNLRWGFCWIGWNAQTHQILLSYENEADNNIIGAKHGINNTNRNTYAFFLSFHLFMHSWRGRYFTSCSAKESEHFFTFRVDRMWMRMGAIGKPFTKCILLPNFTCAVFRFKRFHFSRRSAIAISNDHSCYCCCHCHWGWDVVNNNLWLWHLIWNWENMLIEMDGIEERPFKIQNTFSMSHSHCKTKTISEKRLPKVQLESISESVRERESEEGVRRWQQMNESRQFFD